MTITPLSHGFENEVDKPRRKTVIRASNLGGFDFKGHLLKLAQYRDLIYTLSLHRIKVRYKQSLLGITWALLQPIAMMIIFTLIFSFIARMPSDGIPYPVFAYTALLPWLMFSTAVSNGSNSLISHTQLITKVYFPREILPLTYVVAAVCDFLIASMALLGLLAYYRVALTWNLLWLGPIVLVLVGFISAMTLILSAVHVRFRDIAFAVPLMLQVWMFSTPVIYPLSAVPERIRSIYELNPMVGIIENFRRVVLQASGPDLRTLCISAIISAVLLMMAYVFFKRVETTMADVI